MINPLVKYNTYHKNKINITIHKFCVPLILMTGYSVFPLYISSIINVFYSITYLLFDVFSTKSIHSIYYLQSIFLTHFIFRNFSTQTNGFIHIVSWVLQIIGHKCFENNSPAFLDNLYDSFLFAPYFTFLESFYPSSFEPKDKYTIIKNDFDTSKKSILYFAGLFQKADFEYKDISKNLSSFNHIYININFGNNDIYKNTLIKIIEDLGEIDIECVVGFSFGGSLSLQFKEIYLEKNNKQIKSILISPAGFQSNTFIEKTIKTISQFLYSLYSNDKWFMIKNYPTYQNKNTLSNTDYVFVSTSDSIHNPNPIKGHPNSIVLKHVSHLNMINIIKKQNLLSQLVNNDYQIEKVNIKPLSSGINKLLFGGHFYPYHTTLWVSVSSYNLYCFIQNGYSYLNLFYGFLLATSLWSFTEYFAHRVLLHNIAYAHHKKHHVLPNKLSIINGPMSLVILNWGLYYFIFRLFVNEEIFLSIFIFLQLNYLVFEFTHLSSHSYTGSNNIILNAKNYHKLHHIDENVNYSFVTPFWDYIFGTLSPKYNISFTELIFGFIPFYSFIIHKNTLFEKE
jgi:2-hydroxy fatty acid dioxygenase